MASRGVFILVGGANRLEQRPSGEALVLFDSEAQALAASSSRDKQMVGDRIVDVIPVNPPLLDPFAGQAHGHS